MRAILLASATVATCGRLRDVRLTSHVLRPEDCLVFCSSPVCAPCMKSLRRYLFPRLLVPVSFCLPPVECSPGTTPRRAENPRPFLKAAPLPMAATVAIAVIGPIPGIATRRLHDVPGWTAKGHPGYWGFASYVSECTCRRGRV